MLNHVKMINHQDGLRLRVAKSGSKRTAHIQTDCLDSLRVIQAGEQFDDLLLRSSSTGFQRAMLLQITQKGRRAMPFLDGILINPQIPGCWQGTLSIQAQTTALQLGSHLFLKTRSCKTGANLFFLTHMSHRTAGHLLANRLA
jgi:hypothetical protein